MARIFLDPYAATASPISDSVSKLGMALLANRKSPEEQEYLRARSENAALENEKIRRGFRGSDEVAGYAADENFNSGNYALARAAAIRAGMDPSKIGDMLRLLAYTQNGAPVAVRDSAFMGAGGNSQGTETGHKKTLDNAIQQTGMQVAGANARNERDIAARKELALLQDDRTLMPVLDEKGTLVMRPKSEVGKQGFVGTPVLADSLYSPSKGSDGSYYLRPNQPNLPVAGPRSEPQPFNVRLPTGEVVMSRDGVTTLQGAGIPVGSQRFGVTSPEPIGSAEAKGLRDAQQGQTELAANIGDLRKRLAESPNSLGAVGTLRSTLQSALQQGDAFAQSLGINVDKARQAAAMVDPALAANFDPNLPQIDLLANVIAYQAAGVFAGQQGRDVSNRDFAIFRNMIGDSSVLGNAKEMGARLDQIETMLGRRVANTNSRLDPPKPGGAAPQPAPAAPRVPRYNPQTRTIE